MLDCGAPVLASEPRHLHAAERHLDWGDVVMVEPAGAGLKSRNHPMTPREVVGEHARRKTVLGGVGAGDDVVLIIKRQYRHYGSENLVPRDCHIIVTRIKHGGSYEKALGQFTGGHAMAAHNNLGAFGPAAGNVTE